MEFRRFVSYVYAYRENEKQQNCGFVRVEIRQNMVRFFLHMSLPEKKGVEYKVYGFVRNGNDLEGVFLGVGRVKNGNVDVRMQMNAEHLGLESDEDAPAVSIDELAGMIVVSSDFCRYGTVWDEGSLAIAEFQERQGKTTEKKLEKIIEEHMQIESEELPVSQDNMDVQAIFSKTDESELDITVTSETKTSSAAETVNVAETVNAVKTVNAAETVDESTIGIYKASDMEHTAQSPDWWEQLKSICSPIEPFGSDTKDAYIRIEPKELKYLPPQLWYLGRNSFLLHGYYNYRYLILGNTGNGFVLGVPGMYFPMEEGIASMFGFGRFVEAPRQPNQRGRFGFWCRKIL